jgi:hypothetical protein
MLDLSMFFPLMKTPNLEGFLDLIYQAPNNWENRIRKKIYMHLIWSENSHWRTQQVAIMSRGDVYKLKTDEIDEGIMRNKVTREDGRQIDMALFAVTDVTQER